MKKYTLYILILTALVGIFGLQLKTNAQTPPDCTYGKDGLATNAPCVRASGVIHSGYQLLAPLPCDSGTDTNGCVGGKFGSFDPKETGQNKKPLGAYLNLMIKIILGLAAVLAMVMIVIGGVEYMTTELISGKEAGKERIRGAILGLLLALGAYALLNTINPELLKNDVTIPEATIAVTLDQANFAKTEQAVASVGTGYKTSGTTTSGVSEFVNDHLGKGESLTAITVDTATKKAYFYVGNDWKIMVAVPINLGQGGVAESGQAQVNDLKTPKGVTTISSSVLASNEKAVVSQNGYNLGAAFVNIGATANGTDRGIGFHGSANNALGTTNGCIRMSNDDLIKLAPYMKAGVKVIIK